jgi:hypothetical protein
MAVCGASGLQSLICVSRELFVDILFLNIYLFMCLFPSNSVWLPIFH